MFIVFYTTAWGGQLSTSSSGVGEIYNTSLFAINDKTNREKKLCTMVVTVSAIVWGLNSKPTKNG